MALRKLAFMGLILVFCHIASGAESVEKSHRSPDEIRAEIKKLETELEEATGRPIKLQAEALYAQDHFDVVPI